MKKTMLAALAMAAMMPALASARVFVGIRPMVGYGYGYGYGPYWGPYYGGWPSRGTIVVCPATGAVKFDTHDKTAKVYVDDAFVGTVAEVKTLHLRPGSYDIQVAEPGRASFEEKVFVSAGSTVKLHPQLAPVAPPPVGS